MAIEVDDPRVKESGLVSVMVDDAFRRNSIAHNPVVNRELVSDFFVESGVPREELSEYTLKLLYENPEDAGSYLESKGYSDKKKKEVGLYTKSYWPKGREKIREALFHEVGHLVDPIPYKPRPYRKIHMARDASIVLLSGGFFAAIGYEQYQQTGQLGMYATGIALWIGMGVGAITAIERAEYRFSASERFARKFVSEALKNPRWNDVLRLEPKAA